MVSDLDYDGMPVIDIKPYQPDYRAEDYKFAGWHERLLARVGHV
jgi:tRNA (Thr-GGU) A37 N-methylase